MDSQKMKNEGEEPASKRLKLSSATPRNTDIKSRENGLHYHIDAIQKNTFKNTNEDTQSVREAAVGIRHYVNPSRIGFSGVLKKRYTDFIVNEIALDGTVHHLTDDQAIQDVKVTTNKNQSELPISSETPSSLNLEGPKIDTPGPSQSAPSPDLELKSKSADSRLSSDTPSVSVLPFTPEDESSLIDLFGEQKKNEIVQLFQRIKLKPTGKSKEFGYVLTAPIPDRQIRGQVHGTLRRIFHGLFESSFDEASKGIRISAATKTTRQAPNNSNLNRNNDKRLKGKVDWDERGGEFLHMCLFKQDRDTMEVISHMARTLKVKPNTFSYAGTKDRRAVTTQRVSAYRIMAETIARINGHMYNATLGNFKYEKQPLELGELKGNLFTITLRDCQFPPDESQDSVKRCERAQHIADAACKSIATSGFINYFGLQRFGTFQIGTHTIGKLILQNNFAQAVASILMCSSEAWDVAAKGQEAFTTETQIGKDEIARAQAIRGFGLGEIKLEEALSLLPRRFNAERNILNHLKTRNGSDFLGALLSIPRNLRLMYVHAYQSFVWNEAASERWAKYGNKVIKGDLVLVDVKKRDDSELAQFDECGEVIIQPAAHDFSIARDSIYERARPLTSEDVLSGNFNIFDVVLPLPGFDIEYPDNDIGEFYMTFMGSEQGGRLDPSNMRRKQKDFSLSGSYRKLMAHVSHIEVTAMTYHDENAQLVATDMDKLLQLRAERSEKKLAAVDNSQLQGSVNCTEGSTQENSITSNGSKTQANHLDMEVDSKSSIPAPPTDLRDSSFTLKAKNYEGLMTAKNPSFSNPSALLTSQNGDAQEDISLATSAGIERQSASQSDLAATEDNAKIGLVLKFDLSLSQYATMLLRELMGADNVQHYQPEFGTRKTK